MKTAISLPDTTYAAMTRRAQELGVSRSQLFVIAAERLLAEQDGVEVTKAVNDALRALESPHSDRDFLRAAGRRVLDSAGW